MRLRARNIPQTDARPAARIAAVWRTVPSFLLVLFLVLSPLLQEGCKRPSERRKEQARLDSLRRDSARPAYNPYKFGQGNTQYNRERENLGNIDSLVTPPKPAPSGGAMTPRP